MWKRIALTLYELSGNCYVNVYYTLEIIYIKKQKKQYRIS